MAATGSFAPEAAIHRKWLYDLGQPTGHARGFPFAAIAFLTAPVSHAHFESSCPLLARAKRALLGRLRPFVVTAQIPPRPGRDLFHRRLGLRQKRKDRIDMHAVRPQLSPGKGLD